MCILSSSFVYLFWLANEKCKYQEFCMGYSDETWCVGRNGLKYYPCVLLLLMHILSTSFAYLFWLAKHKNANIAYLSTSFAYNDWLIAKKRQTSRALLDIPQKVSHAVYSVKIAREQAENREMLVIFHSDCKISWWNFPQPRPSGGIHFKPWPDRTGIRTVLCLRLLLIWVPDQNVPRIKQNTALCLNFFGVAQFSPGIPKGLECPTHLYPIYTTLTRLDRTGVGTILCLCLLLICHHFFYLLVYINVKGPIIVLLSKFSPGS